MEYLRTSILLKSSTVEYKVDITLGEGEWSYAEDSVLKMAVQEDLLHHTDENTLTKYLINQKSIQNPQNKKGVSLN